MKKRRNIAEELKSTSYGLEKGPVEFISTGSIPLNLAASGRGRDGGWARGRIVNIVGDKSSGKTLLAVEACAWAYYNFSRLNSSIYPKVKYVDITYNNVEGVLDLPVAYMYGDEFFKAVNWEHYSTIEESSRRISKKINSFKADTAYIWVEDSFDALDSEQELDAYVQAVEKNKEIPTGYDLQKQKFSSKRYFKMISDKQEGNKLDFTFFVISQVRDKIGVTFGERKYRAGGKAIDFYPSQVCWLTEKFAYAKNIDGHVRTYGIEVVGKFKKNKTCKPHREGNAGILFHYGVSNLDSMINWYFNLTKDTKQADFALPFLDKPFKQKEALIKYIADNDLEDEFCQLVEQKWYDIEKKSEPERKKKF